MVRNGGNESRHERFPDEIEQQKVKGIEGVEGVLGDLPLDETSMAVVEVDRDEGKACLPADRQYAEADGGLQRGAVAQGVERQDETHAYNLVVGVHEPCRGKQSEEHSSKAES